MYHSFLLRSRITIIVLDNSKYCLMSICFILELRFQVKLFMKLCSQEIFKAWFVTTSLDLGPCWIVWSFERCWERCLSNRFIPWKTDSLSVKVLLQKMTVSFRECIPIIPTALTINTSYLNLDKVLLSKHETYLPNFVEKCIDILMLERGSRSLHHVQHEVNSIKSEKISHQPRKNPLYQQCFPQITANRLLKAVLWFHRVKHAQIPDPKHLAAQCQQLVPAEVLFQRVTVSLSGVKVCFPKGGKTRKNCASGTSESSWNCFGSFPVSEGIWGLSIPNCLLDRLGL